MKPYVIKQGDYLLKIAHILGFDADLVWNGGQNAELKALRKDPSMLKAGDVLFVPDEPKPKLRLNQHEANAFVARVPAVKLALHVAEDGEPLKNKKYVIEGLGDESEQVTDGDGKLELSAPVHVREVIVRFVETGKRLKLAIGELDPPDTPSGARMRLTSLGFYGPKLAGKDQYVERDDEALRGALRAFQASKQLAATGDLDDATRDALVAEHGS